MRVIWGTPVYGTLGIHPQVVRTIVEFDLANQERKNSLTLFFPEGPSIAYNRNRIIQEAIKIDADWIIMCDSDTQIKDKDFFNKMVEVAYKFSAPVVGLPVRLGVVDEVIFNFADKDTEKGYVNYKELPKEPKEVGVMGTGCIIINVKWVKEHLTSPYFSVIDTPNGFFPEDWAFSEYVKKEGGKIVVEPRIATIHWKTTG